MDLEQSIHAAHDLTLRLQAALKLDDPDLCTEILALRQQAMALFEEYHRCASPEEQGRVAPQVRELQKADQALQNAAFAGLDSVAQEFRANLNSGPARSNAHYQTGPSQACVDIKA
jgi:hypothetical protein